MKTLEIIQEFVRNLGYQASGAKTGYIEVSSGLMHIASMGVDGTVVDVSPPGHSYPMLKFDLHDPDSFRGIQHHLEYLDIHGVHSFKYHD